MVNRTEDEAQSSGRVARACERCRRQKLKCDATRPCTMCVRSGMECEPRTAAAGSRPPARRQAKRLRRTLAHASPGSQKSATSQEHLRSGASSSSIGFAANVFGDHAALRPGDISSIPGHAGATVSSGAQWTLQTMAMPPASIMEALLDAYFDRVHWFIFIFHEPSFMHSIRPLLHLSNWDEQDRGRVVTALAVAALGLQCVTQDANWSGHELLTSSSLHALSLRDSLIAEVRSQLVSLLEGCSLETVQVCILLGTYHIYHGSPVFAWNLLGLSVRTAYALSLHCEDNSQPLHPITAQVRHQTWNHVTVADTFAAMIYGRPSSLDSAFSPLHQLKELEDTRLSQSISNCLKDPAVTGLTFHMFKYRLYEIIRSCLHRFRMLNLQNPISADAFTALVETIVHMRTLLDGWKAELPLVFNQKTWGEHDPVAALLNEGDLSRPEYRSRKNLYLQIQALQLTYESAVIFINRPLLEYQVAPENRAAISGMLPVVYASMDLSLNAALRVSRVQHVPFETQFAISFVLMNFFTAGVILCLPPTIWPFSNAANEAKAGILRIIHAVRKAGAASQIAEHTQQLLTRLFKLSVQQELENGLNNNKAHSLASMMGEAPSSRVSTERPASATRGIREERVSQTAPMMPFQQNEEEDGSSQRTFVEQPYSHDGDFNFAYYGSGSAVDPVQNQMNTGFETDPFETGQYHQIDHQVDEALSNFGQMLFNLVPNDPYSAWTWGSTLR